LPDLPTWIGCKLPDCSMRIAVLMQIFSKLHSSFLVKNSLVVVSMFFAPIIAFLTLILNIRFSDLLTSFPLSRASQADAVHSGASALTSFQSL